LISFSEKNFTTTEWISKSLHNGALYDRLLARTPPQVDIGHQTTNLGVGGSNPSGRASQVADLAKT
jgi:hypothetical protein